ncbi:hypothetical protein BV898_00819 [Hypsibius exemplaris]|uniref:Uncharacterized protein n=1 Tax=Hypsibius exemplaris TaxID=2072580 RepID=A0A1W0XCA7_HYPEX|nr:hypothetical protein BV898_00819 [Hypsibius exemplaris]
MKSFYGILALLVIVDLAERTLAHVPPVRDSKPNQPGPVRDASPSRDGSVRDGPVRVAPIPSAPIDLPRPVVSADGTPSDSTTAHNTSGIVLPVSSGTQGTVDSERHQQGTSLGNIRDQFVGGVAAILGSGSALVGLGVHTVEEGVKDVVRPVVQVAHNVVNKTAFIATNLQHAGHEIVGAWGNSFQQSKNITGQLLENIGRRR